MAQFARPDSDVTVTSFTGSPTNTAGNRFQNIDESSSSDSDYCWGANNSSSATYECGLSNVTDPNVDTGHVVRWRYAKTSSGTLSGTGGTVQQTCGLYQGTTLIASSQVTTGGSWTAGSFTLSESEAGNITDYTNLRLRFTQTNSGGGGNARGSAVSWAELEVPSTTQALAGTISATSQSSSTLSVTKNLAGSLGAASSVAGDLTVTGAVVELAGTASAQSTVTGAVGLTKNLTGIISAQSTVTGAVGLTKNLVGSAAALSTATGDLTVTAGVVSLAGIIPAQSTVTGAVGLTKNLVGAALAQSAATGAVGITKSLSGLVGAQSNGSGSLSVSGILNLSGGVVAQSMASGSLYSGIPQQGGSGSWSRSSHRRRSWISS